MKPTTKKWNTEKVKTDTLRSIGNCPEEEKEGYGGKDLQKRKVLSLEWNSEGVVGGWREWRVDGTDKTI